MRRFIIKVCSFFVCLSLPMLLLYVMIDPFKVVKEYQWYYEDGKPEGVRLNRGWVGFKTFSNHRDCCKWDSFVFGSSRSMNYSMDDWKKYIGQDAKPYHFNAYGETLLGMNRRLHYAIEHSDTIKNCLLVMDRDLLSRTDPIVNDNLKNTPPYLYGGSVLKFQYYYFHLFYSYDFLALYLPYILNGRLSNFINIDAVKYNLDYNEVSTVVSEELIRNEPDYFYSEDNLKKRRFIKANESFHGEEEYEQVIDDERKELLMDIHTMLTDNGIDYRVIISPMYYGKMVNHQDFLILQRIFSKERVFDFSGDSLRFDYHNFYDAEHYRTTVADYFMGKIYSFD